MNANKLSLRRINKDIVEIIKSPIEGIGIVSLNNNPMEYIVNIELLEGIYKGYCLQLLLTFSDNYPINPPKILIYPRQYFNGTFHHHIFKDTKIDENGNHFYKFCFDLLANDFLSTNKELSGWNPSYTISSFLLQVQSFLCDPDIPKDHLPDKNKIKELMKSMDDYERIFTIQNGNEEIKIIHNWKDPYPKIFHKNNEENKIVINIEDKEDKDNKEDKEDEKMKIIKDNLTCFLSKLNYIDDHNILLGYPIKDEMHDDIKIIPIPEILSFDSYMEEFLKKEEMKFQSLNRPTFQNRFDFRLEPLPLGLLNIGFNNNNNNNLNNNININNNGNNRGIFTQHNIFHNGFMGFFDNIMLGNNNKNKEFFKSANNEFYNNWLPIFINEEHFFKNKTAILNSFSIIKYGNSGEKCYDFQPEQIFEILPNLLAEMILKMVNNNLLISSSFIKCFFQYILLYQKLCQLYKNDFIKYVINNYYSHENLLFLLKNDYYHSNDKQIVKFLKILILLIFIDVEIQKFQEIQKV